MEATTICAHCGHKTAGRPLMCASCHEDPRVQGRYRLEGELGRGGGGVTWRARREPVGEPVCLKELRWATMGSLDDERRFTREGGLLEALEHPAIPRHFGAFAWGEGRAHALFIAQELVVGENLEVERQRKGYTLKETLAVGVELAEVLVYLHGRLPPVVHRDIKPSNVMRRVDGKLVLIDFGAARLAGLGQSQVSVAGTFGFMAPEQIRGEAGPPADIYGLGMTLAVLMSGGAPEDLLGDDNRPRFGAIPGVRRDLRELLEAMCAMDPAGRPSAAAVVERCRAMLRGPQVSAAPQAPPPSRFEVPALQRAVAPRQQSSPVARFIVLGVAMSFVIGIAATVLMVGQTVDDSVEAVMEATRNRFEGLSPPSPEMVDPPPIELAVVPEPAEPIPAPSPVERAQADARSCQAGDAEACRRLTDAVQRDAGLSGAVAEWPAPLTAACEGKGVASACAGLAQTYSRGLGVEGSRIETRKYYGKACDAGDMNGCQVYGHMLLKGDGGKEDWKGALAPLDKACAAGDHDACLSVGAILAEGKGVKTDRPKALSIFDGLCQEQKLRPACENVDAMIGNNWGLPASGAERVEVLARLCDHRSGVACERLGDDYARGRGVKKDASKAQELYTAGCDIGQRSACKKMK